MQEICDLYFIDTIQCDHLRFVSVFDRQFIFDKEKQYSGYIGANISRIKALHLLRGIKKLDIKCFLVPVDYRDRPNISRDVAFKIAAAYAAGHGYGVTEKYDHVVGSAPLFWSFKIINDPDQKAGGAFRLIGLMDIGGVQMSMRSICMTLTIFCLEVFLILSRCFQFNRSRHTKYPGVPNGLETPHLFLP